MDRGPATIPQERLTGEAGPSARQADLAVPLVHLGAIEAPASEASGPPRGWTWRPDPA